MCSIIFTLLFLVFTFAEFDIDGEYFKVLTSNIDSYQHLKQLFPILMDTVLALINIGIYKTETLTWFTLKCVKKILIVLTQACVQESDVCINIQFMYFSITCFYYQYYNIEYYFFRYRKSCLSLRVY